jgi:hypothetical protein
LLGFLGSCVAAVVPGCDYGLCSVRWAPFPGVESLSCNHVSLSLCRAAPGPSSAPFPWRAPTSSDLDAVRASICPWLAQWQPASVDASSVRLPLGAVRTSTSTWRLVQRPSSAQFAPTAPPFKPGVSSLQFAEPGVGGDQGSRKLLGQAVSPWTWQLWGSSPALHRRSSLESRAWNSPSLELAESKARGSCLDKQLRLGRGSLWGGLCRVSAWGRPRHGRMSGSRPAAAHQCMRISSPVAAHAPAGLH